MRAKLVLIALFTFLGVFSSIPSHGKGGKIIQEFIKGIANGAGTEVGKAVVRSATNTEPSQPVEGTTVQGNLVPGDKAGAWRPSPGYVWKNPDDKTDLQVVWKPGKVHPDYEHVVASETEGQWMPETGYRWSSSAADDLSVRPRVNTGANTINRVNTILLGDIPIIVRSPNGFNEVSKLVPDFAAAMSTMAHVMKLRLVAVYLSDRDVARLLANTEPEVSEQLILSVLHPFDGMSLSKQDFLVFKKSVKKTYDHNMDQVLKLTNERLAKGRRALGDTTENGISQFIPGGVFHETDYSLCASSLSSYEDGSDEVTSEAECHLWIKGRLLSVSANKTFANAKNLDLEWVKAKTVEFSREILALNTTDIELLARGRRIYDTVCFVCHMTGAAGAPMVGDKKAWGSRIEKGVDALMSSAKEGVPGTAMPPRGTCADCSDDELNWALQYMLSTVQ